MRQLHTVFEGQRTLLIAIFIASLFVNVLVLTAPLYMLQLFSRVLSSGSMPTLIVLTIGAGIALLSYFFFDILRHRLVSRLGTRLETNLGPTVLTVLVQATSATDTRGAQPVHDLQEIRRFVTGPSFIALLDAPWSILFVALIFLFHPVLGFVALIGITILLTLGILSEYSGRKHSDDASDAAKKANATVDEMLRNAEVIRSMGKTSALVEKWKSLSFGSMVAGSIATDRIALMTSLAKLVRLGLQIAILGTGVMLVLKGELSPGVMIATSILLGRAAAPVEQSIAGWRSLMNARQARNRLNALLGSIGGGQELMELPEPAGYLSVENATVVVANRQNPLLFDVTFKLKPGDSLGLIGPSGAGKTTLAKALVGLQQLSRGFIRIDDAALTDWPHEQIGNLVGFLPQRVELFDGTIAENIATMDDAATPSVIVEAAKRAEVHDLILTLPGGYNARVGLRGELLSAGQRQRIGLARSFYGNKRLIVLDEPNANLDPEGEEALARAVSNATENGSVVIVITHRLSILRRVSHAAVLQEGKLVRFGPAREIIESVVQPMNAKRASDDPKVAILQTRPQQNAAIAEGG